MENFQIEDELYRIPTELKPFRKVNTLHWMFFCKKNHWSIFVDAASRK